MIDTDLTEKFIRAAERAAATVERVACTPEALAGAVLGVTAGAKGILLAEPDSLPAALFERLRQSPGVVSAPAEKELAAAEVGVSDAFAGVARTGSVCVPMTRGLGGSVSLFTRWHIAVLSAGSIVARPRDIFEDPRFGGIAMQKDLVFVTGPSATADMGTLVRGVHGPGRLHIIILED